VQIAILNYGSCFWLQFISIEKVSEFLGQNIFNICRPGKSREAVAVIQQPCRHINSEQPLTSVSPSIDGRFGPKKWVGGEKGLEGNGILAGTVNDNHKNGLQHVCGNARRDFSSERVFTALWALCLIGRRRLRKWETEENWGLHKWAARKTPPKHRGKSFPGHSKVSSRAEGNFSALAWCLVLGLGLVLGLSLSSVLANS